MNSAKRIFSTQQRRLPYIRIALAVVLIGIILFALWFDINRYKPLVVSSIAQNTNQTASINKINYSLLEPGSGLIEDITLGEQDSGFYIEMDSLAAKTDIFPLLAKTVSIEEVHIKGLSLKITESGLNRFINNLPKKDNSTPAPSEEDQLLPLQQVAIKKIFIESPKIELEFGGKNLLLEQLAINISDTLLIDNGVVDIAAITSKLVVTLAQLQIQQQLISNIKLDLNVASGISNINNFSADLMSGNVSASGLAAFHPQQKIALEQVSLQNLNILIDQAILDEFGIELSTNDKTAAADRQPEKENEVSQDDTQPVADLVVKRLQIVDSNFDYQLGPNVSLNKVNLDLKNVNLRDLISRILKDPLNANLDIAEIRYNDLSLGRLSSQMNWAGDTANISTLTLAPINGDWIALTLSGSSQVGDKVGLSSLAIENFHLDTSLVSTFFPQSSIQPEGGLNLSGKLSAPLFVDSNEKRLAALSGNLKMDTEQIKVKGINLDSLLNGFKDSHEFGLRDVGGFMLGGPIGILGGKLFSLAGGAAGAIGETNINKISLSADIQKGLLKLSESAVATGKNRFAFNGGIDLARQKFKDFDFAILDEKGCATIKQTLNGDLTNPKSAIANTLLGTITNPLKDVLTGLGSGLKGCKAFYSGDVVHPKN